MVFRHYEASVPETVSLAIGPKGLAKFMRINSTTESIILWFNSLPTSPRTKAVLQLVPGVSQLALVLLA